MFREGLIPAWESFPHGGAWIIKVRKRNGVIKQLWEQLLFACVGELFDEPNELAGVCLSTRMREDNLSVWVHRDHTDSGKIAKMRIGEKMREILSLDPSIKVHRPHRPHRPPPTAMPHMLCCHLLILCVVVLCGVV